MADHAEDKDVPMEDQDAEVKAGDENDLSGTKVTSENNVEKNDEENEEEQYDSEAASEMEFGAEDDRTGQTEKEWTWHIELYPISPEDTMLDNFVKLVTTAEQSNVLFRTTDIAEKEKRGEAHFYTSTIQSAKVLIRTICCRKFSTIRPFVYVYYTHEDGNTETAVLRLDLIEAAKMRWDRQRKNVGDPSTRVAKVSNVPLGTSKEFLNIVFARAYHIKRESDESEAEAAKKATEAEAKATETNNEEEDKADEDKDQNNQEDDDELVGDFNGNLTIDCVSRTSLKGFLLGYRRVTIGTSPLNIRALSTEDFNMEELRREVRKKRTEEAKQQAKTGKGDDSKISGRGGYRDLLRGRGARGARGGNPRGGSANRGGIMTGRQKMEEKMRRGGGRDIRGGGRDMRGGGHMRDPLAGGRGPGGYGPRDDMQFQMAMNTYRLERQMISMRGRGRGYGLVSVGTYGDYPDPYEMSAMRARHGFDYDPRDDWGYRSAPMPRYRDEMAMGRLPMRGMRGRRM